MEIDNGAIERIKMRKKTQIYCKPGKLITRTMRKNRDEENKKLFGSWKQWGKIVMRKTKKYLDHQNQHWDYKRI